jgi:dTDP-glucose 4,6-dehydratase
MPERFLILGANSFYGRNFAELVKARGGEVSTIRHYGLEDCDYIVNFASKSLVAESWDSPEEWVEANALAFTQLIRKSRRFEFKKFVHVSTPEVYGSVPFWVYETQGYNPTTPYAVSRAAGDMMLKAYGKAYGLPYIITRTANIYGEGQQDYRIIPKALAYKKSGESLPLHGGGESRRSFIHVKDACEATYLLCKEGKLGQTYHIGTKRDHSIRDVVEMIGCKYHDVEDRLGKDEFYLLNTDRLRAMGWSETISLEEGLRALSH